LRTSGGYDAPTPTARFSQDLLIEYAAELGLRPFDEDFYAATSTAFVVRHTDPPDPKSWVVTLSAAQGPRGPLEEIGTRR
jgi:hypothetical protein